MLSLLLALTVGLAGLGAYLAVLLLPTLGRRTDLPWSAAALFYSLVLWFCAAQVKGALLLGQLAAIALILWLGAQVLQSRWALLSAEEQQVIRSGELARQQWRTLQRQSPGELLAGLRTGLGLPEKEAATPGPNPLVAFWRGLQGRKSHGKEFLREEAAPATPPETGAEVAASEPEASTPLETTLEPAEPVEVPDSESTGTPATAPETPPPAESELEAAELTAAAEIEAASEALPVEEPSATAAFEAVVEPLEETAAGTEELSAEEPVAEIPEFETTEAVEPLEEPVAESPGASAEAIAADNWVDGEPGVVAEVPPESRPESDEVTAEAEPAEPTWVDEAPSPEQEPPGEPAIAEAEPPSGSSTVVEVQYMASEPEAEPQAIAEATPASNEPIVISDLSELLEPTPELAAQLYRQPIPPEEQAAIDRDWEQEEFV